MRNIILASSSSIHGSGYLEYLQPELKKLFAGVSEILFIPYARPSGITYGAYTEIAKKGFEFLRSKVKGIHDFENAKEAIENAEAIFVGGGNTFLLVSTLYKYDLIDLLRQQVLNGVPYLGTSAGSNICGVSMQTTNDMPIVLPQSFKTLGVIPYNINAHFIVADKNSTHKGETRETRIKEYHVFNETPVIGLQEGSWLRVVDSQLTLEGVEKGYFFEKSKEVTVLDPKKLFLIIVKI